MRSRAMLVAALAASMTIACSGDAETDAADDASADSGPVAQPAPGAPGDAGRATLRDAQGNDAGSATLTRGPGGLAVEVQARGLTPGEHGIHVHTVGRCDAATGFESAGEHLDPGARMHGLRNPDGPHVGDMENLLVQADGTGRLGFTTTTLIPESVHDADGSAIVIHADRDDQVTDPSGNSGDRVACGVLER